MTHENYYNELGVNITNRINTGTTLFFENRLEANKIALQKRTYVFEVFDNNNKIGYGVAS